MIFTPIFQTQIDRQHLLQSFLIALSFTPPLEAVQAQSLVTGFVKNAQDYVSIQLFRGWLIKQDGLITLSDKGERFVRMCNFSLTLAKKELSKQTNHDVLLVRVLFLCLVHLEFEDIIEIRKQKHYEPRFIPDLTIITKNQTLLVEVETGRQSSATVETKINGLLGNSSQPENQLFTVLYFTDSDKIYTYFRENYRESNVQFVYLQSPSLTQDLLGLNTASTRPDTEDYLETEGNENLNVNTAAGSAKYSSLSHTNQTAGAAKAGANSTFLSPELTSPVTRQPIKKATIQLAPNVFVYDTNLATTMQQPLPEAVKDTMKHLETTNSQISTEAEFEQVTSEVLRLMEFEQIATDEEDFDED